MKTTVWIPLHGVAAEDPRIESLLDVVVDWAEDHDIQSPVFTVITETYEGDDEPSSDRD